MVPDGWKLTSLREVCIGQLQTGPFGSQLHANEYTDNGVPVLMPKDLIGCRANIETAAKISVERSKDLSKHVLKVGDLLFSRRGDVARFALIDNETAGSLCGTGCLKATPSREHSPHFLAYFLQKNAVRKWLEQNAVGQTMPNMNTAILSELPLMVAASKGEEEKIAQTLFAWDKAITTIEKLITNSQQQKKALMQQLLTGKKRFPGFEGEWIMVKLNNILAEKKRKGKIAQTNEEDRGVPYIGSTSFDGVFGLYTDSNNIVKCVPSDILVLWDGENAGKVATGLSGAVSSTVVRYKLDSTKADSNFIVYCLIKDNYKVRAIREGSGIPHMPGDFDHWYGINLPPLKEQQKITSILSSTNRETEALQQKLELLKQEKKALMQQLLTGKRRVKVDKEAA